MSAARMSKQERVYVELRKRIREGAYGPGHRIVIDALASEMGVSAIPVREAVRRLEAEGLVLFRPNAGAQVAPVDPVAYHQDLTVLAVLEGYATVLASQHITESDIDCLSASTDQMQEAMEHLDPLSFSRHNQQFHSIIYDRCPNAELVTAIREIVRRLDAIRRTVFLQIPTRGLASIEEHRHLIELLRRRAPAYEIETAARSHKLATVDSFDKWRNDPGRNI
ncbi:GntR family transcriptional regulator [Rhodococcus sp. NPDC060176]|uniref:GntR family transcriptional regulator n=1 Tax=Rhodococcus sp. NPDC060176 TaxID=3347062 RepID=UPI00364DC23E